MVPREAFRIVITMSINRLPTATLVRLLQLSDSALPVGTFSFSNTLESAVEWGIVSDNVSLEQYCTAVVRTTAFTDAIAALHVHRAYIDQDYARIIDADSALLRTKLNDEARQMTQRMGRKLTELSVALHDDNILGKWHDDIRKGAAGGTYAATQGIIMAICGISRQELFGSICYGAANIILSAALRCMRTSYIATQRILWNIASEIEQLYIEAADKGIDEMNTFSPECDIMASLHEKGDRRLFMN